MNKKIIKLILVIVILFSIIFYFLVSSILNNRTDEIKKNEKNYSHLQFEGILIKSSPVINDICLLKLKLVYSNTEHYDTRKRGLPYFCVIDKGYIEVVGYCSNIDIGNTFIYEENMVFIKKNNKVIHKYIPTVYNFRNKYSIIKKLHDL